MQKIGVFVCWCGSNIAGTVDVAAVVEAVKKIPDVAYAVDYKYMCSEEGQKIIKDAVAVSDEDDVVVTTAGGIVMRTHAADISVQGRSAQGVRVIRVDSGDKVTGVAVVSPDDEEAAE